MSTVTDQQMLDAINQTILTLVTGGVASYTMPGGKSLSKLSLAELQKMKSDYELRVSRAANGIVTIAAFRLPE